MRKTPSYDGSGLVNLVAEIEHRLIGSETSPRLEKSSLIPDVETYVLVLFDGLGMAQLEHAGAGGFRASLAGSLDAPFPTTTSVSLATIASGEPPSRHGQIAHLTWMPDLGQVVNCLKWINLRGEPVAYDYSSVLARPNLWERLRAADIEPITVQPSDFSASPLSRVLYRGARFEGAWDTDDLVNATLQLASEPRRFIFTYVPHVDFAGHVFGLAGDEFSDAMRIANDIWSRLSAELPPGAALLGTADHGLKEFSDKEKLLIRDPRFDELRFAGDSRGVHLWGDLGLMQSFATESGGSLVEPSDLFGPDLSEVAKSRLGEKLLLAPKDLAVLPRGFDKRLRCYHGGLTEDEVAIPLLIG